MKTILIILLLVQGAFASITTEQIGAALGLTNVALTVSGEGVATITATEEVTPAMQAKVQAWHAAGAVNAVPAEVGAGQIRAAMIASGIAADVDALDAQILAALNQHVADATQRAVAVALWRHATGFKRDHATITLVAAALGKTSEEIDDLFRLAATF